MGQFSKPWKDLTFTDNFIFCKVMQNEKLCKKMIEVLLDIQIEKIEYLATEKEITTHYDTQSIRLDVYVKDSDRVFDIEMQTGNYSDLLLRARYYQGASDVALVKHRTKYKDLKETFILFICKDDPFNCGLPVYTQKSVFKEAKNYSYNDKSHKVFYNASAWNKIEDGELRNVLRFIYESTPTSHFTEDLKCSAEDAKSRPEWEVNYMYLSDVIEEEKEIAREEGLAEGREDGRKLGIQQATRNAAQALLKNGVSPDIIAKSLALTEEEIFILAKENAE